MIYYQESDLDTICGYWAKNYKPTKEQGKVLDYETFIDIYRRKVIFKFITDQKEPDKE